MSHNLSDRYYHFACAATQPPAAPRRSRTQVALQAIQTQQAAVEFDGITAIYTAMRPSERRLAERAITAHQYKQRRLASGMTCYVVQGVKAS